MWMSFKSQNWNSNCSTKPCFYSPLYVMWIWVGEGAASKSMYYVTLNHQILFTKKILQLEMKFLYLTLFLLRSHVPRASPTNSLKDKRWERIEKIFKIIRRVKINNTYQKNSNVKFWYFENWDYWILSIVEILSFKEQVKPHAFSSFTTWLWKKWTVHICRFLYAFN